MTNRQESDFSTDAQNESLVTVFKLTGSDTIRLDEPGASAQIDFEIEPKDMQNKIVWSNDDSSVATVSMTGLVTGLQKGSCTITGKLGSDSITVHVTCDF